MSDEGMLSTPGVEATDSTIAEYVNYSDQLRNKTEWLKQRGKSKDISLDCFSSHSPTSLLQIPNSSGLPTRWTRHCGSTTLPAT